MTGYAGTASVVARNAENPATADDLRRYLPVRRTPTCITTDALPTEPGIYCSPLPRQNATCEPLYAFPEPFSNDGLT
ncbi:MAG TPA: hypothetical protein DCR20_04305 [Planctomycetaceae bacterium]|nr:hypothetical protein [Planctomycetaceae bacterium]